MILHKMGIGLKMINWIKAYDKSATFAILINGFPTNYFSVSVGLCQGCTLSPLMFLIIMDGMSRKITDARECRLIVG